MIESVKMVVAFLVWAVNITKPQEVELSDESDKLVGEASKFLTKKFKEKDELQ